MAKFSTVNTLIGADGGAEAFFILKELLKAAGWVVMSSSDGTTYSAVADVITTSTAGAGGMNNASAWFRIQEPGGPGRREWTFQKDAAANDHTWRVKYSANAKFVGAPTGGGATDNNTTPSATDETIIRGGGTDAAPTFASFWAASGGGYRFHIVAQSTPEGLAYSFWGFSTTSPGGVTINLIFQEALLTGTFPVEDTDPVAVCMAQQTQIRTNIGNEAGSSGIKQWYKYGLGGAAVTNAALIYPTSTSNTFETMNAVNPYNNKHTSSYCVESVR